MLSDSRSRTSAEPSGSIRMMGGQAFGAVLDAPGQLRAGGGESDPPRHGEEVTVGEVEGAGLQGVGESVDEVCSLPALLSWRRMIHRVPQVTRVTDALGGISRRRVSRMRRDVAGRGEVDHGAVERGEQ